MAMGVRFMMTICLIGAILGSMLMATGQGNPFILVLTIVAWVFVIIGALIKP